MFIAMLAISKRVDYGGGSRNDIFPCAIASAGVAVACWIIHIGMIESIMVCGVCNAILFVYVRGKVVRASGGVGTGMSTGVLCSCGVVDCDGGCCV